ncbi:hypothetical protein ACFL5V_00450 [Fibrobacterota bacterium]
MIIRDLKTMKERSNMSWPEMCRACNLEYSTVMRWLGREESGVPPVFRPGPKKTRPFSMSGLMERIRNLNHGKKRTAGTGELYDTYSGSISRRDFGRLAAMARKEVNDGRAMDMRRVDWKTPGIVWSMDDTELGTVWDGSKIVGHLVMDLGSRYKFPPDCGPLPAGDAVAESLERLFNKYGPPLFLKMDNHWNFRNKAVFRVLARYFVIPLFSPPYYSPYNGSIEKANGEFKEMLADKLENVTDGIREHLQAYAETAVHDLNHKDRGCLYGTNSCRKFFAEKDINKFYIRERRTIFDWIKTQTRAIMEYMEVNTGKAYEAAWRIACETWLRLKGFISVSVNGKVLPNFGAEISHN